MKFDMHCHIKGGSIDSHIDIDTYINLLRSQGFGGMLVTDHDSYKGYNNWESKGKKYDDFVVLKGIEYDTRDAGHFIVIMPDGIELKVLTIRGMSLNQLTELVHLHGGVLGPAHPFGARSSSAMFCRKIRHNTHVFKKVDFIEAFNTCEPAEANAKARELANYYRLACTGGSDSHNTSHVGKGFTDFTNKINCNNDLIEAIRTNAIASYGGQEREILFRHIFRNALPTTLGFKAFNRGVGLAYIFRRRIHLKSPQGK